MSYRALRSRLIMAAFLCVVTIILSLYSRPGLAWGDKGHQIVCEIAFKRLSDSARAKVSVLIKGDPKYTTFSESCLYADLRRRQNRYRSNEHYVNLDRNNESFEESPCPLSSKCVVSAAMSEIRDLAISSNQSHQLEALKFLGHWVGDLHQPLHVSFRDDKGANDIDVSGKCRGDLHRVWDSCIIRKRLSGSVEDIADELLSDVSNTEVARLIENEIKIETVIAWAQESYEISIAPTTKYCHRRSGACWYERTNKRLDHEEEKKDIVITDAYIDLHVDTVRARLLAAGVRLGDILNRVYKEQ